MHWQGREPQSWPQTAGVVVLEAEPGAARDAVVSRWTSERAEAGGRCWRLECAPAVGGTWAGLNTLVADLVRELRGRAPDLLSRHAHELCLVLPALEAELDFPQTLTDTIAADERTRNHPADRAYRSLHGLIELLSEWHEVTQPGPVSIACDHYDAANGLVRRFFAELVRRRGSQLALHLLVSVAPGAGAEVAGTLDSSTIAATVRLALPRAGENAPSPAAMTRLAGELAKRISDEPAPPDERLPGLIDAWRRSDSPERAVEWQVAEMSRYNHAGLYEASMSYAADVAAALDRLYAEDHERYFCAVHALYFAYVPTGRAEAARPIVERALARLDDAGQVAQLCYLLAMLRARFIEPTDQAKAEELLERALAVLDTADMPDAERHFHTVFMMNGLALVRLRQRRVADALELCRSGVARLNEHLDPESHRLHRSVLLFNIAQVHAQVGPYEQAIAYFTQAMAIDPNYSEYYNDRGAVFFKMDRLDEAERDYLRAIELSPPYAEVWTNLGQCYRAMERMEDAVRAYSRALDLDPTTTLAIVGRADARSALDQSDLALEDYDTALAIEPDQPLVLGSRAILHYEAGRLEAALDDLDTAVGLAPDVAELFQNRSVALLELGRSEEAARDLRAYLELCPDAEDRGEVEESLEMLVGVW
jgi:tetratricopeptide (TPR) repeat protein